MRIAKTLNWLIALAGAWEIIAPFALGYSAISLAVFNAVIVGIVLLVLGIWAALSENAGVNRTLDWINAIIGAWLVIAPFILGYALSSSVAVMNAVIVGIIVAILGIWAAIENTRVMPEYWSGPRYGRGYDFYPRPNDPYAYEPVRTPRDSGIRGAGTGPGHAEELADSREAAGPYVGMGPQNYERADERILDDVVDRLTLNGRVNASNIEVQVEHGEVTLRGTVATRPEKHLAEDVADSVVGVKDVHNELRVQKAETNQ